MVNGFAEACGSVLIKKKPNVSKIDALVEKFVIDYNANMEMIKMAKKKPARKPINAKTKATLQKKAANSKYTYGQLAQVYRRGQGAYLIFR